jgi:diadenosine tetraphosphate (Ap4A) HIT family hydrolase
MSSLQAIHFAQFVVTKQVFYTSRLCAALVNLKPILPGHSLVIPRRVVPRYADLAHDEVRAGDKTLELTIDCRLVYQVHNPRI